MYAPRAILTPACRSTDLESRIYVQLGSDRDRVPLAPSFLFRNCSQLSFPLSERANFFPVFSKALRQLVIGIVQERREGGSELGTKDPFLPSIRISFR